MSPVHVENAEAPEPENWRRARVLEGLTKAEQAALLTVWEAVDKDAAFRPVFDRGLELGAHNMSVGVMHAAQEHFEHAGERLRSLVDLANEGIGRKRKERVAAQEAVFEAAVDVAVALAEIRRLIESGKRGFREDDYQTDPPQEGQASQGAGEAGTDQQG